MAQQKSVEWLNDALSELYEIAAYIQETFDSDAAERFVLEAYAKSERQAQCPETGRPSSRFKTIRWVKIGNHHRYVLSSKKQCCVSHPACRYASLPS